MVRSFQISAVFPHLSVRENVRIALQRPLGTFPFLALGTQSLERCTSAPTNWSTGSA
jgi:branched-chain amino acid transport system ATP-binding protein